MVLVALSLNGSSWSAGTGKHTHLQALVRACAWCQARGRLFPMAVTRGTLSLQCCRRRSLFACFQQRSPYCGGPAR